MSASKEIQWFHSFDLGNGVVTTGHKSADLLEAEFNRLQLTDKTLQGKKVLDIGSTMGSCLSDANG